MESFFSTLKAERLSRKLYRTRDALRAEVFDFIERFHTPQEVPLGTIRNADMVTAAGFHRKTTRSSVSRGWPVSKKPSAIHTCSTDELYERKITSQK